MLRSHLVAFALLTLTGCGGSLAVDSTDGGEPSGSGSGASSSGGHGTGSGGIDGGVIGSPTSSPPGGPTPPPTVTPPGPPPTGTSPPPPPPVMSCGTSTCNGSQQCCASLQGDVGCVPAGSCSGITLTCTSGASCPNGEHCCSDGGGFGIPTVQCAPKCGKGGPGPGQRSIQLCATTAECEHGTCQDTPVGIKICSF